MNSKNRARSKKSISESINEVNKQIFQKQIELDLLNCETAELEAEISKKKSEQAKLNHQLISLNLLKKAEGKSTEKSIKEANKKIYVELDSLNCEMAELGAEVSAKKAELARLDHRMMSLDYEKAYGEEI